MATSEQKVETEYKIRRKSDGLFSAGGTWPRFSKRGKTWRTKHALAMHLAQFTKRGIPGRTQGDDLEVLVFERRVVHTETLAFETLLNEQQDRGRARKAKKEEAAKRARLAALDVERARLAASLAKKG